MSTEAEENKPVETPTPTKEEEPPKAAEEKNEPEAKAKDQSAGKMKAAEEAEKEKEEVEDTKSESEEAQEEETAEDQPEEDKEQTEDTQEEEEETENAQEDEEEGEDEEEEEGEDEDSSDEELPLGSLEAPVEILDCKRERKKSKKYMPSDYTPATTPKKGVEIPEGSGVVLGDHPMVEHNLQKNVVADLKTIHKFLYSQPAENVNKVKANIRLFSGFAFEEGSKPYKLKKIALEKYTTANLKWVIELFDVQNAKGKKDDMVEGLLNWLMCPQPSGKDPKSKKTPKKSPKKSATKRKSTSTPKTPAKKAKSTPAKSTGSTKKTPSNQEKAKKVNSKPTTPKPSSGKNNTTSKTKVMNKRKSVADEPEPKKKQTPKSAPKKKTPVAKVKITPTPKSTKKKPKQQSEPKPKNPSEEQLESDCKDLLQEVNLETTTMKDILRRIYAKYPHDSLIEKKQFLKDTVKQLISNEDD